MVVPALSPCHVGDPTIRSQVHVFGNSKHFWVTAMLALTSSSRASGLVGSGLVGSGLWSWVAGGCRTTSWEQRWRCAVGAWFWQYRGRVFVDGLRDVVHTAMWHLLRALAAGGASTCGGYAAYQAWRQSGTAPMRRVSLTREAARGMVQIEAFLAAQVVPGEADTAPAHHPPVPRLPDRSPGHVVNTPGARSEAAGAARGPGRHRSRSARRFS